MNQKGDSSPSSELYSGSESVDELLEALTAERRRMALYYLDRAESLTLGELSRRVAAAEAGASNPATVAEDDLRAVYLDLYHNHLPKLSECDVVEHDDETGRIECPASRTDILDAVVDGVEAVWSVCHTSDQQS